MKQMHAFDSGEGCAEKKIHPAISVDSDVPLNGIRAFPNSVEMRARSEKRSAADE